MEVDTVDTVQNRLQTFVDLFVPRFEEKFNEFKLIAKVDGNETPKKAKRTAAVTSFVDAVGSAIYQSVLVPYR